MTTRLGLALTLLLLGATGAAAREPTAEETALWDRTKQLWDDVSDKVRTYEMRIDGKGESDYQVSPFYRENGDYEDKSFTNATQELDELFKGLAELEKTMAPLAEAVAQVEKALGNNPGDVQKKVWAEFGRPVNKDERNYGLESPDKSKWLESDVNWPFKWYGDVKKGLSIPAAWRDHVSKTTVKKLDDGIAAHEKQYADYKDVDPSWHPVERIRRYLPALEMVIGHRPGDAALTEAKTRLEAAIKKWQTWCDETVDAQRMAKSSSMSSSDIIESTRKLLATSYAQQFEKGEILAVIVTGDEWWTAATNIVEQPIQYGMWVQVACADAKDKEKGLARVHEMKVYTKKEAGVQKGPPLDDLAIDRTFVMRLKNVGGDGGGGGGFFKFICGLGCCFMFLAAAGGGGFFAYKQMNAAKAAGAAPAAGTPPAPPTG